MNTNLFIFMICCLFLFGIYLIISNNKIKKNCNIYNNCNNSDILRFDNNNYYIGQI